MTAKSQKRATEKYRERLSARGMTRFEVLALNGDRKLLRDLAGRLAVNDGEANEIRASIRQTMATHAARKGGIAAALRRSPLVGAELEVKRPRSTGRKTDL